MNMMTVKNKPVSVFAFQLVCCFNFKNIYLPLIKKQA
jgi:hypothetical protein